MNRPRLAGRTALITGAASGLGYAIAETYAREGARVIITDINKEGGEQAAETLQAEFHYQDVAVEAEWSDLAERIRKENGRLDILVNNAGYGGAGPGHTPEDVDLEETRKTFRINFEGTLLGCKYGIMLMKEHGGSIINISSVAALVPVPFITGYGAAKAAVRHLTRSVALYCAQQGYAIRCNSIHPGQIRTAMHTGLLEITAQQQEAAFEQAEAQFRSLIPTGEFGKPEDVADAALFLAGEESRYVTGDRILVDGGMMLTN